MPLKMPLKMPLNMHLDVPLKHPARIPFLDGVRGYAALWVMLGHFSTRTGYPIPVLDSPDLAVDLFMIVSGFLMTQHFFLRQAVEPWESPRTWLVFYLRRFFRIAPLYYTLLLPSFLAFDYLREAQRGPLKTLLNIDYHPAAVSVSAANVLGHISFLFGLSPTYCDVLTMPDWSLGLEMQFYAAFPFLMLLARRFNIFRFSLLGLAAWGFFRILSGAGGKSRSFLSTPSLLPLSLGLFLIGMLLAWAWMEQKGKLTPPAAALLLLMAGIAACTRDRTTAAMSGTILVGASILMAFLLFQDEEFIDWGIERPLATIRELLGNRVARFLADVSYGVYLLHMLVMVPVLAMLCEAPWFVQQRPALRFLILTTIAGPVTCGFAWILFRTIEAPGIRLGKVVIDRFGIAKRPSTIVRAS